MVRIEANERNGVCLEIEISPPVTFAGNLGTAPQAADDEQGKDGEANDAGQDRYDDRLRRHCKEWRVQGGFFLVLI